MILHMIIQENRKGGKIMRKLLDRAKYVVSGEEGASNVEIIVWISVVLVIATVLFLFRDSINDFIMKAIKKIDSFEVDTNKYNRP